GVSSAGGVAPAGTTRAPAATAGGSCSPTATRRTPSTTTTGRRLPRSPGPGGTLRRPLGIARLGLWGVLGHQVSAIRRHRRVVAMRQVVGIELFGRAGNLVDLGDPGLHQVDRQRRVAQGVGLLLPLAQEVGGKFGERAAL